MVRKGINSYEDKERRKKRREFHEQKDLRFPKRDPLRTHNKDKKNYRDTEYDDLEY